MVNTYKTLLRHIPEGHKKNSTLHAPFYAFYLRDPLYAELNPIRHLLALVGARHTVHVSRVRVKHWF
jgi:hypothetical protein